MNIVKAVTYLCPTLCDPMDCSTPGSSVHVIFQAGILEQILISYSRRSSQPRDWTCISWVSCAGRWILSHCAEPSRKTSVISNQLLKVKCYHLASIVLAPIIPIAVDEPSSTMVSPTISPALQRKIYSQIFSNLSAPPTSVFHIALINGISSVAPPWKNPPSFKLKIIFINNENEWLQEFITIRNKASWAKNNRNRKKKFSKSLDIRNYQKWSIKQASYYV